MAYSKRIHQLLNQLLNQLYGLCYELSDLEIEAYCQTKLLAQPEF